MKANELRIGNYLLHNGNWSYRSHSAPKIIKWEERDWYALGECTISLDDLSPIPLTKEWLIKFGLIDLNCIKTSEFPFGEYIKTISFGGIDIRYTKNAIQIMPNIEIQYVHQLQNLYFALTGEELTA